MYDPVSLKPKKKLEKINHTQIALARLIDVGFRTYVYYEVGESAHQNGRTNDFFLIILLA